MIVHITTEAGLQAMKDSLDDDYILDNDIDLSGVTWTPVGTNAVPFTGSLDGQNHIIKNLTLDVGAGFSGIFGACYNAVLKNINLEDFVLNAEDTSFVGSLVGEFNGNSDCSVENCHGENIQILSSDVNADLGYLGGLIGYGTNDTAGKVTRIEDCDVTGSISISGDDATTYALGGFIGGSDGITLEDCYSTVEITIEAGDDPSYIGGFVGFIDDQANKNTINNCYATGDISISNVTEIFAVGGFCGCSDDAIGMEMYNCHSTGTLTFDQFYEIADIGGFIGCDTGSVLAATINKCFSTSYINITAIEDISDIGGFIGNFYGLTLTNCYAHGDITMEGETAFGCGGFIGNIFNPVAGTTIENAYSSGKVTASLSEDNTDCSIGGFIGYLSVAKLINVYSVSDVEITCDVFDSVGGFVGYMESTTPAPVNCAWHIGSYDCAIGDYNSAQVLTLESESFGTDEPDNTTFWYKIHVVYDQGNTNAWDFATPIWYERYLVEEYPTFEGVTLDTTNDPVYQGGGQIIKDQYSANQVPKNEPRRLFWSHFHQRYICAMCLARVQDKRHEVKFTEDQKEFSDKLKSMGYING